MGSVMNPQSIPPKGFSLFHEQVLRNFRVPKVTIDELKTMQISIGSDPQQTTSKASIFEMESDVGLSGQIHSSRHNEMLSQPNLMQAEGLLMLSQPNLMQEKGLLAIDVPTTPPPNNEVNRHNISPKLLTKIDSTAGGEKYCWRQVLDVEKFRNGHHVLVQWQEKNDNGEFSQTRETLTHWIACNAGLESLAKWAANSSSEKIELLFGRSSTNWKRIEGKMLQMGLQNPIKKKINKSTDRFGRNKKRTKTKRQL